MHRWRSFSLLRRAFVAALFMLVCSISLAPQAAAHAELRQSSPAGGETVGGDLHSIALQFFDLDLRLPVVAAVFDASGTELPSQVNQENQRVVIALVDPIETNGDYLVTYEMTGLDGDFTQESFTFTWQEGASEPSGITVAAQGEEGFDVTMFVLLLIGGALAAFLVHRFMSAYREHKAAQSAAR